MVAEIDRRPRPRADRPPWLIDPMAETLEMLALDGGRWVVAAVHAGAAAVRAVPFEAVDLELALLWDDTAGTPR
jgi:hypothetical protein